ncbi:hypothetical protein B484DRAFT_397289 [Ochromonadaceae sp. CCMP2298]|nr:hypothetical protein B484DRAFT_397289 [Ochromonadaceae sp. CCMP2298]
MSRTYHNSSADTQNQGNSLGDRSSVRLSKTRLGEGQGVKDILGGGGGGGNENRFNQNNHNSNEGYSYSKTQSQASKESYGYDKYDKYDNKYEQAAPQYEGGYAPQSQYPQYEAPAPAQSYAPNQFSRKSSHSGMGSGSGKEKESFNLSYDDRGTADWARESDSYQQGQTSSRQSRQAPNSSDEYYDQGPGEDARTVASSI